MKEPTQARRPSKAATFDWHGRRYSSSSADESTQARLMKARGDLSGTLFSFNASLPACGARARGLGMDLVVSDQSIRPAASNSLLIIADVDNDPNQATPVAEWNTREERHAHRGDKEERASFAIKAGDRLCAVNGMHGDDGVMVELLASAASLDSPKAVQLTLERARSDVLGPQPAMLPPLPPKLPTTGKRHSIARRRRSNSIPDVSEYLGSRPDSVASDSTAGGACGRNSKPTVLLSEPLQWGSMLSTGAQQTRGRQKAMEDEDSTRSNSVSLSGRSSSLSTCDTFPASKSKPRTMNFASIGRAALNVLG